MIEREVIKPALLEVLAEYAQAYPESGRGHGGMTLRWLVSIFVHGSIPRWAELVTALPTVSESTLRAALRGLERDGLVNAYRGLGLPTIFTVSGDYESRLRAQKDLKAIERALARHGIACEAYMDGGRPEVRVKGFDDVKALQGLLERVK